MALYMEQNPLKSHNHSDIIIDYAHTPEALSNVLQDIKKETIGKIILVFDFNEKGKEND